MPILLKPTVERISHEASILIVRHEYVGRINTAPKFNSAVGAALRTMACQIRKLKDGCIEPQIRIWTNEKGVIVCEAKVDDVRWRGN